MNSAMNKCILLFGLQALESEAVDILFFYYFKIDFYKYLYHTDL